MHKHLITVNGDPDISPGHICPDISPRTIPPGQFPIPFTRCRTLQLPPPLCNLPVTCTNLIEVDRLGSQARSRGGRTPTRKSGYGPGSRVRVGASFQKKILGLWVGQGQEYESVPVFKFVPYQPGRNVLGGR